jgi:hypothetical protein
VAIQVNFEQLKQSWSVASMLVNSAMSAGSQREPKPFGLSTFAHLMLNSGGVVQSITISDIVEAAYHKAKLTFRKRLNYYHGLLQVELKERVGY